MVSNLIAMRFKLIATRGSKEGRGGDFIEMRFDLKGMRLEMVSTGSEIKRRKLDMVERNIAAWLVGHEKGKAGRIPDEVLRDPLAYLFQME
jgi:hypothetical protein